MEGKEALENVFGLVKRQDSERGHAEKGESN
jgi:hypothetical protein